MNIARWTTPSISYKPSANAAENIAEIYLVIKQRDVILIKKDQTSATINEEGAFVWEFAQGETSVLEINTPASIKVDYKTNDGKRYTTKIFSTSVSDSAIDEEI